MFSQWGRLPVDNVSPLLVKHDISSSAYTVQVTDLTSIWVESLDRKQIIRRALDENASIDPSEGPGQLMKLLQEIEKALQGQPYTSLKIQYPTPPGSITLEATVVLPTPLSHLAWYFRLSPAPQKLLTSDFVLPCLSELVRATSEVASLLTHIKDKDHVIRKLVEKLEAAGIDLTTAFPSATLPRRSKANARELVLESIRGLNEFNLKKWQSDAGPITGATDIDVLCKEIFDAGSPIVHDILNEPHDNQGPFELKGKSSLTPESYIAQSPQTWRSRADDVQEFQVSISGRTKRMVVDFLKRQLTPVRSDDAAMKPTSAKRESWHPAPDTHISGSETSDDDLEGPISKKYETAKPMPTLISTQPRKLGVLGGKKQEALSRPSQTTAGLAKPGEVRSSERMIGHLEDRLTPLSIMEKSRPKLGKIGGPKREANVRNGEVGTWRPSPSASLSDASPSTAEDDDRNGRQFMKKSSSPIPARETSQERADRNRARLRRELEEKNKVPVKKKRKF